MAEHHFDNRDDALQFLTGQLRPAGDDEVLVTNAFCDWIEQQPHDGRSTSGGPSHVNARVGRWVIKDGDLDFFKSAKEIFAAGAGTGLFLQNLTAGGAVTAIIAVVTLAVQAYRHGVTLNKEDLAVLLFIRTAEHPVTVDQIAAALAAPWNTPSHVETVLKRLSSAQSHAGLKKLVEQDQVGRWITADI